MGVPHISSQEMKGEITKFNSPVKAIKPLSQRRDTKGNDRGQRHLDAARLLARERGRGTGQLLLYVLRAVLANAPNSVPPERPT